MVLAEKIVFIYFTITAIYTLVLALAGHVRQSVKLVRSSLYNRFVILVPAYKEDAVIVSSVKNLQKVRYPRGRFEIVVIADSLNDSTVTELGQLAVRVLVVSFPESTKAKSINAAIQQLQESFDIVLISDADNILDEAFLENVNDAFNMGYHCIQGRRVPKNLNSNFAILDAVSEQINNHLFRKAYNGLGLSASLIGSGMAFSWPLFRELFPRISAIGVFEDKVLQLLMVDAGQYILYLESAIIFDEKVDTPHAFQHQRKRWFHGQLSSFRSHFLPGINRLIQGKISYFNLAVFYHLFPPRILTIFALFILSVSSTLSYSSLHISFVKWWILFAVYSLTLLSCIPHSYFGHRLMKATLHLPVAFFRLSLNLFGLRKANRGFIHTPHKHHGH